MHHNSYMKKLYQAPSIENIKKRGQFANEIDTAKEYIYSYLEQNSEECQLPLDVLKAKIEGDYRAHIQTEKT